MWLENSTSRFSIRGGSSGSSTSIPIPLPLPLMRPEPEPLPISAVLPLMDVVFPFSMSVIFIPE